MMLIGVALYRLEIVQGTRQPEVYRAMARWGLGIVVLRVLFDQGEFGRAALLGFVVAVWTLQLTWSTPWLARFQFGPFEWLWRVATYRRWQSIRR